MGGISPVLAAVLAGVVGAGAGMMMSKSGERAAPVIPPKPPPPVKTPEPPPIPPAPPDPYAEELKKKKQDDRKEVEARRMGRKGTILTGGQGLLTPPATKSGGNAQLNKKLGGGQ